MKSSSTLLAAAVLLAHGPTYQSSEVEGKRCVSISRMPNDQIPQPAAVRYAWAANPLISMENGAGLPMRPFRTDTTSPQ